MLIDWTLTVTLPEPDLDESDRLGGILRLETASWSIAATASGVEAVYSTRFRAQEAMDRVREECPEARCVVERGI